MGTTKVLISDLGVRSASAIWQNPCGVCLKGVGTNSIFWAGCSRWIHKKCSCIPGRLKTDASFRCKRRIAQARPIDGRLMAEVTVGRETLEVKPSICYLWDCFPQVSVVNSLLSQDSTSPSPSATSVHFPSAQRPNSIRWICGVSTNDQVSSQGFFIIRQRRFFISIHPCTANPCVNQYKSDKLWQKIPRRLPAINKHKFLCWLIWPIWST